MSALKICPQCGTEYELDQRFCPKDGSTLKAQGATDLVGSIIADRYHVLRKLGEGGMGTVYLAEHVKMGRKSAVKVMNPGTMHEADAIGRFNREAANASRINHPNVAAVYDFGETSDGLIYLAMEFVDGPSLTEVIREAGSLSATRSAEIARQAAEALSVAHDMGIVHRDLKPDNIMLAKNRDGSDSVKVVDFGIAKVADNEAQKVTKTGLVVGTPEYMSPEQLAGDKLDGRSDIYSLGLVAFAMMTGKLPFPAETAQESMIARLTDDPKRLAEMKPDVTWPVGVQAVMDRALQRDVANRYQSASQFGRDLHKSVASMEEAGEHQTTIMRASLSHRAASPGSSGAVSSGATDAVPATKVNRSTKSHEVVAGGGARSWRAGVAAVAGALVLAVGAMYALKPASNAAADSGAAAVQTGDSLPANGGTLRPPVVDLSSEVERLSRLLKDSATAEQVLAQLQPHDSLARASTPDLGLRFRYLRAKSLLGLEQLKAGCDSLYEIEGAIERSQWSPDVKLGARNLIKTCKP